MFYICKRKQSNIKYISSFYCVLFLCHSVLSSYVCHVTSVIKHAHRQLTLFHVHKCINEELYRQLRARNKNIGRGTECLKKNYSTKQHHTQESFCLASAGGHTQSHRWNSYL